MGGEISIKDKGPGERGTCFAFNVLLKISEVLLLLTAAEPTGASAPRR